jgi:hypothetical protein
VNSSCYHPSTLTAIVHLNDSFSENYGGVWFQLQFVTSKFGTFELPHFILHMVHLSWSIILCQILSLFIAFNFFATLLWLLLLLNLGHLQQANPNRQHAFERVRTDRKAGPARRRKKSEVSEAVRAYSFRPHWTARVSPLSTPDPNYTGIKCHFSTPCPVCPSTRLGRPTSAL